MVNGAFSNPPRNGEGDQPKAGGGGVPQIRRPETYLARKLRKDMSLPEVLLWQQLRGKRAGVKFRRHHPIGPYVADFFSRENRLIIEVDGDAHNRGDRPMRDETRERFFVENGYKVIRIPAAAVLADVVEVAHSIGSLAASPLHHSPSANGPPPRSGEDKE